MNPKYIFTAFFAVASLLTFTLPRLSPIAETPPPANLPITAHAEGYAAVNAPLAPQENQVPPTLSLDSGNAGKIEVQSSAASSTNAEPTASPQSSSGSIPLTAEDHNAGLSGLPDLSSFAASLAVAPPGTLVGVYAPGLFALPVIQQPSGDNNFVSLLDYTITQYNAPAQYGATALLAHNYLGGRSFFQLQPGQEVILVYGGGGIEKFRISEIEQFQALHSSDPYSDFIDLSDPTGQVLPYSHIFQDFYTTPNRLVFQTCIDHNGDPSWGRIFIVADPV